jgi:4-hydroxyphenylacetate 3-monooxygenase
MGQINCGEEQVAGYHTINRRYVYAALHWCTNHYSEICDSVRELMGAGVFQMPADVSVLNNVSTRDAFETYWSVPGQSAEERMKLFKLAWDLLGSDFAGRHLQYEKFYAGPGFVMNSHSYLAGPWKEWTETVDRLMASYECVMGVENRCGASTSRLLRHSASTCHLLLARADEVIE